MSVSAAQRSWLLWGFVAVYVLAVGLHVREVTRTGFAQLPVYAIGVSGDYPVVAGYRMETDSTGSGLLPGDRLLKIGDRDLRGVGPVGFQAIGLARTTPGHPVALTAERDGVTWSLPLEARPHVPAWSRLPALLFILAICALLLLRAPGSTGVRAFCITFLAYGLPQAVFYGGPEWQTWIAAVVWNVGTVAAMVLMLRWCIRFPEEMPAERRIWGGLPWLAAALYVLLVRANYFTGWPVPIESVPRVSMASHGIAMLTAIAIMARNYRTSPPVGQRRVRWILLGTSLGSAPMILAALLPLILPEWRGFEQAHAVGYVATVIWMLSVVMAVSLENAFDVDRLIGGAAAWSLAAAAAVAGLAVLVPAASAGTAGALGVEEGTVRLAFAALLGASIVPLGMRLRPRVDQLFFPDRVALQEAADRCFDEFGRCDSAAELVDLVARRFAELTQPVATALYERTEDGYALRNGDLAAAPPELSASFVPPMRIVSGNAPRELRDHGVELVVPLGGEGEPAALLCHAAKRSGDVYTATDTGILTTLIEKANTEWLRFAAQASDRESRAKTDLLATASHDLRQPLHAVGLVTDVLASRVKDDTARDLSARIGSATRDLDAMLTTLLDRSKLDAGVVTAEVVSCGLGEIFDRVRDAFEENAEAKGVVLRVVPTRLRVRSDPLLLGRILGNLVSNAVRYTEEGSVMLTARRRRENVLVEVRDSGVGIDEASRGEIFDAFRQLEGGSAEGLGLGLSIVDGLCRVLGHELTLRSAPGRGSTFSVLLPWDASAEVAARAEAPSTLAGARVLVLDDERDARAPILALLGEWGCDAREHDGTGALGPWDDGWWPDLVVSDHHLADGRTGLDAMESLTAARGFAVPAVVVTAERDAEALAPVRARGLALLHKPVRAAQLRAALAAAQREASAD